MNDTATTLIIGGGFWAVVFLSTGIPMLFILRRLGLSRWFAILYALPVAGYIFIWVLAFIPWPRLDRSEQIAREF